MVELTQEELKRHLHYNLETGIFTWTKPTCPRIKPGQVAGCKYIDSEGQSRVRIMIKGRSYLAHRLAFLYVLGGFPNSEVDHISGLGSDNRWVNLRCVTSGENAKNRKLISTNKSKCCGVHWSKRAKKWCANIRVSGKGINLGYFEDIRNAIAARKQAEKIHGFHANHGTVR